MSLLAWSSNGDWGADNCPGGLGSSVGVGSVRLLPECVCASGLAAESSVENVGSGRTTVGGVTKGSSSFRDDVGVVGEIVGEVFIQSTGLVSDDVGDVGEVLDVGYHTIVQVRIVLPVQQLVGEGVIVTGSSVSP